jgi:signal transduction histidine kinase
MSLRLRLAAAFALVALLTAAAIALATPLVVGRGFAQLEDTDVPGQGGGSGRGPGPGAGLHAQQVQQETTLTLIVVAIVAAGAASLVGAWLAGRVADPLGRLEAAAAAVARGDLGRRSGLGERTDEVGSLGRSFDTMAAELEAAETSRRRFFQDVVHELKTPLTVIEATATAVLERVYEHDDRHLETIRGQARLLARVVDDLRTISLAEAGALPLERRDVDVEALLSEIAAAFAARAHDRGAHLRCEVAPGTRVAADPGRLRQALGALLDNALRHAPPDTEVVLEGSAAAGGPVRLAVRDHGGGIEAQDLPHLFERFYQADEGRDRAAGSSGLGLSIVRAIALAHGGRVGVENDPEGGARFWIALPAPDLSAA